MRPAPFVLSALALALAACGNDAPGVAATGAGPSRRFAVSDFTAVALAGPDRVDVRTGHGFSVRAEGDPAVLDHLLIRRDGDTLTIGRVAGWHLTVGGPTTIFVTMPRVAKAGIAGSGSIVVDQVQGNRFEGDDTGSGDLTVRRIAVDSLALSMAGSGEMAVTGHARALDVSVAGSGSIDARALVASSASVAVLGSGSVRARVDGAATVAMMGSGSIDLAGRPRCSVTKAGSGSVTCAS